ncbi:MAG: mismatch-specific DNA-glycosylase [Proteobacteria bacterium]|nr:mismatch-specific DNA-glycosylase [Pseudomonadota bacterium]
MSAHEVTLPDWLAPGLRIVSVGINPSLPSARAGFPFANPRNRFWPALNASQLVAAPLDPGIAAMNILLERDGIGFTDVVKRATPMERNVSRKEFLAGAEVLLGKLRAYQPALVWLHGKTPLNSLCRVAGVSPHAEWGLQDVTLEGVRIFVTPNPSPANAAFSLAALVGWYNHVADESGKPR